MENPKIVSIKNICSVYEVPLSFFDEILEYELLEIQDINQQKFLRTDDIQKFEKILRLHFDLDINMEGIDVINNLLNKIEQLENENLRLRNLLDFFETRL